MTEFTPLPALLGGILLGLSAGVLWLVHRRAAGISGILGDALVPRLGGSAWRWLFLAGMIAGGFVTQALEPEAFGAASGNLGLLATAGVLVGIGTRLGGGCTSGHGICGLARLSVRSLVAVSVFMGVAGVTVYLVRHVLQGVL